mmetsp:Transcript_25091/g.50432  ORF Transcript_25091/g.50432 Transcript_25091/m.50432 type:complete len:321 (-) Transcript_25091:2211-3173(-)
MIEALPKHFLHGPLHVGSTATLVAVHEPLGLARQTDHGHSDLVKPCIRLIAVREHPIPLRLPGETAWRPPKGVRATRSTRQRDRVEVEVVLAVRVVDDVGAVECCFAAGLVAAEKHRVHGIDAKHARVVLVANLVLPRAKATTRPDAEVAQCVVRGVHVHVALHVWDRVAVLEALCPRGHDHGVLRQHATEAQSVEDLALELLHILWHRVVLALRDFHEQRPLLVRLRHHERREVGEHRHAVKDVLLFREVNPMDAVERRRHSRPHDADPDKVTRLVFEARVVRGAVVAVGKLGELRVVRQHAEEGDDGHGREQAVERYA